jgi:hypothetical protein
MSYISGGLIEASDYNGFTTDASTGLNRFWSTGATTSGWGQTAVSAVSVGATVTATNWATLVNTLSSAGSHTNTAITSRSAPTTGTLIEILTNVSTDINNINSNRGNAALSGSQFTSWTGTSSKTTATGSGKNPWTITFTHTVTWASADAARYFFNAGGRIKWETSKTSTGTDADEEWNDLANTLVGDLFITGGSTTQTIAGTAYTGVTKSGGTGTPTTLLTTAGWYNLTTSDATIYQQFADTFPYTGQFIRVQAKTAGAGTQLILTTVWNDPGSISTGYANDNISGGSATTGISFGTAPAAIVTYFPPSSTYLTTASWGTPTVAATTA